MDFEHIRHESRDGIRIITFNRPGVFSGLKSEHLCPTRHRHPHPARTIYGISAPAAGAAPSALNFLNNPIIVIKRLTVWRTF